jgi:hypothetical protein
MAVMRDCTIEAARAAKPKARRLLRRHGVIVGIGLTRLGAGYAVQVNLESPPQDEDAVPVSVDDVPIVVKVVGRVRKQPTRTG